MTTTLGWVVTRESYSVCYPLSIPSISLEKAKEWVTPMTWCETFYERLDAVMPVKRMWKFKENNITKIYATIDLPSTENILKLSEVYCAFVADKMEKDDSFYFDFLVFGDAEINEEKMPSPTFIRRND